MSQEISQKLLCETMERAVQEITEATAGIRLRRGEEGPPAGETGTVSLAFNRGFQFTLSFQAELTMLERMTRNMMHDERATPQDVEDFTKEYFNVLCGRIAALLYRAARVSARFTVPVFRTREGPAEGARLALGYISDQGERARLLWYTPDDGQ